MQLMKAERFSRTPSATEVGAQSLQPVREQRVAPVLGLSRFRDAFEQFPQGAPGTLRTLSSERAFRPATAPLPTARSLLRDGFDSGRRAPVNLTGSARPAVAVAVEKVAAQPPANAFMASLDDLL